MRIRRGADGEAARKAQTEELCAPSPAFAIPSDLLAEAHDELRLLASQHLERERLGHTLQPTALVHELWIRCAGSTVLSFDSTDALLAFASAVFRRILIDHARRRLAQFRGGEWGRIAFTETHVPDKTRGGASHHERLQAWAERIVDLDDALNVLNVLKPRAVIVFEMRFFGGCDWCQIGSVLNVGERVVRKEWAAACGWLTRRFANDERLRPDERTEPCRSGERRDAG